MSRLISMILIASSRGTGLAMKMFTLPWTKLSMTSFFPVSVLVKTKDIDDVAVRILQRHDVGAPGGRRGRSGDWRKPAATEGAGAWRKGRTSKQKRDNREAQGAKHGFLCSGRVAPGSTARVRGSVLESAERWKSERWTHLHLHFNFHLHLERECK